MIHSEPEPGRDSLSVASAAPDDAEWTGPTIRYDLVKEFTVALVVVAILVVALAAIFSSPDEKPVTIEQWSTQNPTDFLTTAVAELNGTSALAAYGAPYNSTPGAGQAIFGVKLNHIPGVTIPIDTAQAFVLGPLQVAAQTTPGLSTALAVYEHASAAQQQTWDTAYTNALGKATMVGQTVVVPRAGDGPTRVLMTGLLAMARSGALDAQLLSSKQFYGTDYTKPLLFLADGTYMSGLADAEHLSGDQWGMMNETGNYPGQAWLWLYTMWYQISPFTTSGNADALVWSIMMILTLILALVPFIPGLRSVPKYLGLYRLVWRDHYRRLREEQDGLTRSGPLTT